MEKTIKIGDREVRFKANAVTVLVYRREFQKDLFVELQHMDTKNMTTDMVQTIYELAYVMAKQADKTIDVSLDDWLDSFDVFPIETVGSEILSLWQKSNTGIAKSKNR